MKESLKPADIHDTEEYRRMVPSLSEMKLMRDSYKARKRLS